MAIASAAGRREDQSGSNCSIVRFPPKTRHGSTERGNTEISKFFRSLLRSDAQANKAVPAGWIRRIVNPRFAVQ
jgi:hypothetical protein